ncbi:MAG: aconitate hydratase [Acidimicrobiales bacterium]
MTSPTVAQVAAAAYGRFDGQVAWGREVLDRPLTLTEKILLAHLAPGPKGDQAPVPVRGRTAAAFIVDRVAMQDATAQMAILQFMTAGMDRVGVPTTVHCDHLVTARDGAVADLAAATETNREVYEFLASASARYGIGFWGPGSGIIHQVVLERYAFPGGMMIGTDSHTPNAGGLGMVAVGVGGADAVDVMTGDPLGLMWPQVIGVHLNGRLSGWASPKDVILAVAQRLTVSGGTGAVIEYFGPGVTTISATGRATIANMGAEVGATGSVFGYDHRAAEYLHATGRSEVVELAEGVSHHLAADADALADPGRVFDRLIEIDLDRLEPLVAGPGTPDLVRPASALGAEARAQGWPMRLSGALVGSCTNSSYEDIARAASVARQAAAAGLRTQAPLLITPGSEQVRATIERDGLLGDLEAVGARVLANACGPCIGQWDRTDVAAGEPNAIMTSFNRNFPRRNDGSAATLAFVASPEITLAFALAGTLDFDPAQDSIAGVGLDEPSGPHIPPDGFLASNAGYTEPPADSTGIEVVIDPASNRLARLEPFDPWDGRDLVRMPVLVKVAGKCTTDHISAAGKWLRFRGHLDNISDNLFMGAKNAFTDTVGTGRAHTASELVPLAALARQWKAEGRGWVAVGDANYGEGSSREHAAMEPRHLGGRVILARSFARIHETNLKKQGMLALRFADPDVYDLIAEGDTVSVTGLAGLAPGVPIECRLHKGTAETIGFECTHTLGAEEIAWYRAGSALNRVRQRQCATAAEPGG